MTDNNTSPAPTEAEDNALPAWTASYPEDSREDLAKFGYDPASDPHAHEKNLQVMEFMEVVDNTDPPAVAEFSMQTYGEFLYAKYCVDDPTEDEVNGTEVASEDEYLVDYPQRFRSMLQRLGRPDHEHQHAPVFNNALVEEAERLNEDGLADSAELRAFHRRLWDEMFGGEPYPK